MLRHLTILMFDFGIFKLDTVDRSTAPRLKLGDLHLAQALGFPGFSSGLISRSAESEPFIGDKMSGNTKRVSTLAKRLGTKAVTDDYRGSAFYSDCCLALLLLQVCF